MLGSSVWDVRFKWMGGNTVGRWLRVNGSVGHLSHTGLAAGDGGLKSRSVTGGIDLGLAILGSVVSLVVGPGKSYRHSN
jgi:hypothetical protein